MGKGSGKSATNLLRISGILFGIAGSFHVVRYFTALEFRVGGFELTPLGSLIIGLCLLLLSVSCFRASR